MWTESCLAKSFHGAQSHWNLIVRPTTYHQVWKGSKKIEALGYMVIQVLCFGTKESDGGTHSTRLCHRATAVGSSAIEMQMQYEHDLPKENNNGQQQI